MAITPVKNWRRKEKVESLLGKKGKIISWTTIRTAGKLFDKEVPFPVVIIKLQNKKNIILQLVDYKEEELQVGQSVEVVLRKSPSENSESIIHYVTKCKPI